MTKFARYEAHGEVAYGVVEGDSVKQITTSPLEDYEVTDHTHALSEVRLLAPVVPSKIVAIGLNYKSHLGDREPPKVPEPFMKTTSSLAGPNQKHRDSQRGYRGLDNHTGGGRAFPGHRQAVQARQQSRRPELHSGPDLRQRRQRATVAARRPPMVARQVVRHLQPHRAVHRNRSRSRQSRPCGPHQWQGGPGQQHVPTFSTTCPQSSSSSARW